MRYFDLSDDVAVPGRWHLGEVRRADGTEPRLRAGMPLEPVEPLTVSVTHPGRVLEFSLTSFGIPIASAKLGEQIAALAPGDVQLVPVKIGGQEGMVALNALRLIECVDEAQSIFSKWTERDHRRDLAGQYRQFVRLVLDSKAIPLDAHFFRVKGWKIALIVSEVMKQRMEEAGCFGARFVSV